MTTRTTRTTMNSRKERKRERRDAKRQRRRVRSPNSTGIEPGTVAFGHFRTSKNDLHEQAHVVRPSCPRHASRATGLDGGLGWLLMNWSAKDLVRLKPSKTAVGREVMPRNACVPWPSPTERLAPKGQVDAGEFSNTPLCASESLRLCVPLFIETEGMTHR